MKITTKRDWIETMDTVTAIPIVPFRDGRIDFAGHDKNIDYLLTRNFLDGDRPHAIAVAGTSLLHHIDYDDQVKLLDQTGRRCGDAAVCIAGVVPNPLEAAAQLVERAAALHRPPDAYLLMPLAGTAHPEGVYDAYMAFGERLGRSCAARFLLYYQNRRHRQVFVRLVQDSPYFVGIKIGTSLEDVAPLVEAIGDDGAVFWGIGDRCTAAIRAGCRGHTSGLALLCPRLSDQLKNALRKKDFDTAAQLEAVVAPLEEIRFRDDRIHNYSAIVAALHLADFSDVEGGSGGPFNPPPSAEVLEQIRKAVDPLRAYH
jgi:dihydrodipicolinate synthase/N-acetylneuraminate lyase